MLARKRLKGHHTWINLLGFSLQQQSQKKAKLENLNFSEIVEEKKCVKCMYMYCTPDVSTESFKGTPHMSYELWDFLLVVDKLLKCILCSSPSNKPWKIMKDWFLNNSYFKGH